MKTGFNQAKKLKSDYPIHVARLSQLFHRPGTHGTANIYEKALIISQLCATSTGNIITYQYNKGGSHGNTSMPQV